MEIDYKMPDIYHKYTVNGKTIHMLTSTYDLVTQLIAAELHKSAFKFLKFQHGHQLKGKEIEALIKYIDEMY